MRLIAFLMITFCLPTAGWAQRVIGMPQQIVNAQGAIQAYDPQSLAKIEEKAFNAGFLKAYFAHMSFMNRQPELSHKAFMFYSRQCMLELGKLASTEDNNKLMEAFTRGVGHFHKLLRDNRLNSYFVEKAEKQHQELMAFIQNPMLKIGN